MSPKANSGFNYANAGGADEHEVSNEKHEEDVPIAQIVIPTSRKLLISSSNKN